MGYSKDIDLQASDALGGNINIIVQRREHKEGVVDICVLRALA